MNLFRLIKKYLCHFLITSKAAALVEAAFIAPILLVLTLGATELTLQMLLHSKLERAVYILGDLTSQAGFLTNERLNVIAKTAQDPLMNDYYEFDVKGALYLTLVDENIMSWNRQWGNTAIASSDAMAHMSLVDSLVMDGNVIIAEIIYDYKPIIFSGLFKRIYEATIYHKYAVFKPRYAELSEEPA